MGSTTVAMNHHLRVKKEFTRQAETLSTAPTFTVEGILERIREVVVPTHAMRVLDLRCGPGIVVAALAPMVSQVVGST
jgi:tRNA/tmRNA/rRNA uracil-C5-methylase (TrmA/RlmC/RlmD family)